ARRQAGAGAPVPRLLRAAGERRRARAHNGGAMSGGPTYAIVPVKALAQAKRRLAPVLPDAARRRLVLAMLEDVLAAVAEVRGIARQQRHERPPARTAQRDRAVLWAGQLSAAYVAGHGTPRRRQRAAPGRRRPRHRRADRPRPVVGGGRRALWLSRALPRRCR